MKTIRQTNQNSEGSSDIQLANALLSLYDVCWKLGKKKESCDAIYELEAFVKTAQSDPEIEKIKQIVEQLVGVCKKVEEQMKAEEEAKRKAEEEAELKAQETKRMAELEAEIIAKKNAQPTNLDETQSLMTATTSGRKVSKGQLLFMGAGLAVIAGLGYTFLKKRID